MDSTGNTKINQQWKSDFLNTLKTVPGRIICERKNIFFWAEDEAMVFIMLQDIVWKCFLCSMQKLYPTALKRSCQPFILMRTCLCIYCH